VSNAKHCPSCDCVFFTDYDLRLHLKRFGFDAQEHLEDFRFAHREIEKELGREHGGADRAVRALAKIIEDYARYSLGEGKAVSLNFGCSRKKRALDDGAQA
jgi:hypothetical protein